MRGWSGARLASAAETPGPDAAARTGRGYAQEGVMRNSRSTAPFLTLLVLAVGIGCDRDRPGAPTAVPAPQPGIESIEIAGPDVVEPGSSAQLRAMALLADGSVRDVTRAAKWSLSPVSRGSCLVSTPPALSITTDGIMAAARAGDAVATVRLSDLVATKEIVALAAGTFRLTGIVTMGDQPNVPLPAVDIEVVQGTGTGLKVTTSGDGCYALFGLSGTVALRLTKAGYATRNERLALVSHTIHNLAMWSESGYGYWDY